MSCARLADYDSAIDEALALETASPSYVAEAFELPRRRLRRVEVGDLRIGVFDFLSLQGCRMGELAGYRNSPMGRVMPPSRRLVYELELLEVTDACLGSLETPRRERLAELAASKRSELDRHLWNAIWTGEEMERFLSPASAPSLQALDRDAPSSLRALRERLEAGPATRSDGLLIEADLAGLYGDDPLGPMLRRLDQARHYLGSVAERLEGRETEDCGRSERNLVAIFETHYLAGLQPRISQLDRRAGPMLEDMDAIYRMSRNELPLDPALAGYHRALLSAEGAEGLWSRYRAALQRHSTAWGRTLSVCGMLPQAD